MSGLDVGTVVPELEFTLDDGSAASFKGLRGKTLVLYFYPKDSTPGCTQQACDFRDSWSHFPAEALVLGVSRDSQKSHQKFKQAHALPFPLIVDETGSLCEAFGVWVEKSMYGKTYFGIERSTFVIDAKGVIQAVWRKVKVPGHVTEVMKTVAAL